MNCAGDLGAADVNVESLCWGTGEASPDESATFRDSMVGKVIGVDDKYHFERSEADEDDAPEPLALLAIHAAMHMLFLPQFTCDFYEDEANDDDSRSSNEGSKESKTDEVKIAGLVERAERRAQEKEQAELDVEQKEDFAMKREVGLKKPRYTSGGIPLEPKPACIVWSNGIGVKPNQGRVVSSQIAI